MEHMNRVEAEGVIQALTGGASPKPGQWPIFNQGRESREQAFGFGSLPYAIATIDRGTVDATPLIQEVVDALFDEGGGVCFLPPETYNVTSVLPKEKVHIIGAGWGSILKQIASTHTVQETGATATGGSSSTLADTTQSWSSNEHAHRQVHIISGTGSGQVATILSNTTDTLTVGYESGIGTFSWTTPDNTSTYEIVIPIPIIAEGSKNLEHVTIANLQLDGNKANQTAFNQGIYLDLTGGSWSSNDQHIIVRDVYIHDCGGTGILKGTNLREAIFEKCWIENCRHSIFTHPGGGTDNMHSHCTSEGSDLAGFVCNGDNDRWNGCKSFGSGQDAVGSQGAGYLITGEGLNISNCDAQENVEDGFYLVTADVNILVGIRAFHNDRDGVRLNDSDRNTIILNAESAGGSFTQNQAVGDGGGTNTGNIIIVTADSHSGSIIDVGLETTDNIIISNGRYKNRIFNAWGALGDDNEHFTWGKSNAPATNNPQYSAKTGTATPPIMSMEAFDASVVKQFLVLDYGLGQMHLGHNGVVRAGLPVFTNSNRGTASNYRAGTAIWNSDDAAPNYSDGSVWKDAAGANT